MISRRTKIVEVIHHEVGWWTDDKDAPVGMKHPAGFKSAFRKAVQRMKPKGSERWCVLRFWRSWRGMPMEVMYAVRLRELDKKGRTAAAESQLVYCGIPDHKAWVSQNLLYSYLAGYIVQWDKPARGYYTYRPEVDFTMTAAYDADYHPNFNSKGVTCTPVEKFLALKGLPKGFVMYQGDECDPRPGQWFHYIRRWRRSPYVERLVKMGFGHLWDDGTIDRYKDRAKISELVSYMKRERNGISGQHVRFKVIVSAMKKGWTIDKWFREEEFKVASSALAQFKFKEELLREIVRYIHKQPQGYAHYRDYLLASKKAGRRIKDRGVLFPKNYCRQFEELQALMAERKYVKVSKKMLAAAARLEDLRQVEMGGGFTIVVPTSYKDLVELGNKLHNCVGTCGYGEAMADGKILILSVYKNGKPVSCVEVSLPNDKAKRAKVVQNRGDHNKGATQQVERKVGLYVSMLNKRIGREAAL